MPKEVKHLEKRIERLESELARLREERSEKAAQLDLYRKVLEVGREGIALFGPDHRLIFCNESYKQIFSPIADHIQPGVDYGEIVRRIAETGLIPDALSDVDAWVAKRTDDNRRIFDEPYLMPRMNGTWLRAVDYRTPEGGFLAVRTDVTEMKQREAELEASGDETRRILEAFFQYSALPMVIKGTDRRYRAINAAFEKLYAVKAKDVIGKRLEEALPGLAKLLGRSMDYAVLDGSGPISREHKAPLADGSEGTVATSKFPILDADGNLDAIGSIGIDITRSLAIQETLASKSNLLETTLRAIDQGFVVLDKDLRIITCNQRFFDLHNYPAKAPAEGLHLRDMMRHFVKTGYFGNEEPEQNLESRFALLSSEDRPEREERLQSDGRILDVRRTNLPDGGYVATFTDITDLKQAEQLAETARLQLHEILDTLISSVCLYDADQRMVYCNEATRNLFGWQTEMHQAGVRFEDQIRDALAKKMICGVDNGSEEWAQRRLADFRERKLNVVTELSGDRWIVSHFREMTNGGTVVVHRDITDQKHAEEALRLNEENFRSLAENTEIGISISVRRNFQFVNDAFAKIFGYANRDEVYEQGNYDKFIAPSDLDRVRAISDARTADLPAPTKYEFEGLRKDGTTIIVQRTSRMVTWNGVRATLGTVVDVTPHHVAEERLRAALDAAETANRTKSDFLAKMSHELRTPLNAIIGFSEVLARETFGPLGHPRYASYIKDIALSGRHLLEMINDILDMSKIESGGFEIQPVEADVLLVVNDTVQVVRGQIEERKIDLQLDVAPNIPALYADQRAIRQILLNLLSNAIKFTPEGGRITLAAVPDKDGGIELSVADTGIGIAKSDLEDVLKPFNQGSNPHSTVQPGTGLGLPIVKSLTEMHGGRLSIESDTGQGTTVRVSFPARQGRARSQAATRRA